MSRKLSQRLRFLLDIASKEHAYLLDTDSRLFAHRIDANWVRTTATDPVISERLDAFVARFSRLQDTLGDKLVPELLHHLLESPGSALDNINRMEKLGLITSVDDWQEARNLRNKLVHEYLHEAEDFADALNRCHELVALLSESTERLLAYIHQRFGD